MIFYFHFGSNEMRHAMVGCTYVYIRAWNGQRDGGKQHNWMVWRILACGFFSQPRPYNHCNMFVKQWSTRFIKHEN